MANDPQLLKVLRKSDHPDAAVLLEMAKAGADLAKPHTPEFALVFSSEEDASAAAQQMTNMGFSAKVNVSEEPEDGVWVIAEKTMVLALEELISISEQLQRLAESHDGDFDGWGAEIVE